MSTITNVVDDSPAVCRGRQWYEPQAGADGWRVAFRLMMAAGEVLAKTQRYGEATTVFLTAALLPARTALAFCLGRPAIRMETITDAATKLRSAGLVDRDLFDALSLAYREVRPETARGAGVAADIASALFEVFGEVGLPGTKPPRNLPEALRRYGIPKRLRKPDCTPRPMLRETQE